MKYLDLSLPAPAENLAMDEALLDWADAGDGEETLRFWESPTYFVVVGYANKVGLEVNVEACKERSIPILRRCSGGGTVVQGPGCLNYNIVLRIDTHPELATIPQTNTYIMGKQREAVANALKDFGAPIVCGHTDLALGTLKFSGNAQRRKRNYLVFHGTFLLHFDLALIGKLLQMPSKEPDYRNNRAHENFITNLNIAADSLKLALTKVWGATHKLETPPDCRPLVREKYGLPEWNLKF